MRRIISTLGAVGLAAGTAIMATPGPAAAADDWAPTCVSSYPADYSTYVQNDCDSTVKVKVVLGHAPDGDCHTLKPGEGFRETWWVGSYDGEKNC